MLPSFYQTLLRRHLSESQYLTLELLLLLIQTHRCVTLSTLASVFPQPIQKKVAYAIECIPVLQDSP
jgi:hypothetical protein